MFLSSALPVITDDKVVFGLLAGALAFVFYTSKLDNKFFKKFYTIFPPLLMCYMIPAIFTTTGLIADKVVDINEAGEKVVLHKSGLYGMAKNYLLPASLVLMTLAINLKELFNLGFKPLVMFFTATVGIIIGGPIAILIVKSFSPETVGGEGFDAVWRGLSTLAGSWIGGGANQAAMLETYKFNQTYYSMYVIVDIVVANIWMAFLLVGIGKTKKIDKWLNADSSSVEELKEKVSKFSKSITKVPELSDYIKILGVAFMSVAASHFVAKYISGYFINLDPANADTNTFASHFFWMIVTITTIGLILSNTKLRNLEGVGASKIGSVFIYILVATIGMKMNLTQIGDNPLLIVVGLIWMAIHVALLFGVAKLIKAPFFFLAVGSKANVGGAASAPIIAAAFHPSLAPVGVVLAVFGYAIGTYGAILCTMLMEWVSGF